MDDGCGIIDDGCGIIDVLTKIMARTNMQLPGGSLAWTFVRTCGSLIFISLRKAI